MTKRFPIVIERDEDGIYIATCPLLRGCHSYGETVDIALAHIEEAIAVCIDDGDEAMPSETEFIGFREVAVTV